MNDMGLYGGSEAMQAARLAVEVLEEFLGTPIKATGKWLFLDGNAVRGIKWLGGMMQKGYFLAGQEGAVSIRWILRNEGLNNQIIRIPKTSDYERFRRDLLKMGVKFAEMSPQTLNGEKAIFFNAQYASLVVQLLKMDAYRDIAVSNISDLQQDMSDPDKNIVKEGVTELREEMDRKKKIAADPNLDCVTIDKSLMVEESKDSIKTRIPGRKNSYIWLDKGKNVTSINNGRTLFAGLEKDKVYAVVDQDDQPIRTMSGKELYKNYDPIDVNCGITQNKQRGSVIKENAINMAEKPKEQIVQAQKFLEGQDGRETIYVPESAFSMKKIEGKDEVMVSIKSPDGRPTFYLINENDIKQNKKGGLVLSLKEDITQIKYGKRIVAKRDELKDLIRNVEGKPQKAGQFEPIKKPEVGKKR